MEIFFGPKDNPRKFRFALGIRLYHGETELHLGPMALKLLDRFLRNPERVYTHSEIDDFTHGLGKYSENAKQNSANYVAEIRKALDNPDAIKSRYSVGYVFNSETAKADILAAAQVLDPQPQDLSSSDAELDLLERTYLRYQNEKAPLLDNSAASRSLASLYECEPVTFGNQAFPVAILWQNKDSLIHPDMILGKFDSFPPQHRKSSPTLNVKQYAAARELTRALLTKGEVKHEGLDYCMRNIDLSGSLPKIHGRFGYYYDHVLTQFAMYWELKKALNECGLSVLEGKRSGMLPLREAFGFGSQVLYDGDMRTAAISVSMLIVFERRKKEFWTIICKRSMQVAAHPNMLHVVPSGMFEARNEFERWSVQDALWRELLEEVYDEKSNKSQVLRMIWLIKSRFRLCPGSSKKKSLSSASRHCCDLLYVQPEICTVLYVPDNSLTSKRPMHVNWEYSLDGPPGSFGTPWIQIDKKISSIKTGDGAYRCCVPFPWPRLDTTSTQHLVPAEIQDRLTPPATSRPTACAAVLNSLVKRRQRQPSSQRQFKVYRVVNSQLMLNGQLKRRAPHTLIGLWVDGDRKQTQIRQCLVAKFCIVSAATNLHLQHVCHLHTPQSRNPARRSR